MRTALPDRMIPGWYELKNRRYGSAAFWFILLLLPLALILTHYALFIDGLMSLGLSLFLVIGAPVEINKIFNPEIIGYWTASVFVFLGWIGVWNVHIRRIKHAKDTGEKPRLQGSWIGAEIRKKPVVVFFITVLAFMYVLAIVCPWLAPRDPNAQQDITVTQYAAPMQRILYLKLKPADRSALPMRVGEGAIIAAINSFIILQNRLLNREAPVIYVNQYEKDGDEVRYVQGIQKKSIPLSELAGDSEEVFAGQQTFVLGSDKYGRDIFSRLIYGSRISLSIGFFAMLIAVTFGTWVGAVAGYFGKRTDAVLMRWVDLMLAFPNLFLILMIVALFGNSIFLIVVILGLTGWMGVSRIVRGQFLALREMEYIQAAHALGFSHARIIFRHLIPNALAPVIVAATLRLGNIILIEAGLSFLGVGVQPPTASWGNMVAEGRDTLIHAWWISTFPGLAIVLTVICFNMIGDGLRDALDPRMKT